MELAHFFFLFFFYSLFFSLFFQPHPAASATLIYNAIPVVFATSSDLHFYADPEHGDFLTTAKDGTRRVTRVIRDPRSMLNMDVHDVGCDVLVYGYKGMFAEPVSTGGDGLGNEPLARPGEPSAAPPASKGDHMYRKKHIYWRAQNFFLLFKSFEHRGLLIQDRLCDRLRDQTTIAHIKDVIKNLLNMDVIRGDREPLNPIDRKLRQNLMIAVEKAQNACESLLDLCLSLSPPRDTYEEARVKLARLVSFISTDATTRSRKDSDRYEAAVNFTVSVLGSRFHFRGLNMSLDGKSSEGAAAADAGAGGDEEGELLAGDEGYDVFIDKATTKYLALRIPTFSVDAAHPEGKYTTYFLPDCLSTYHMDIVSRAFDYFSLAAAHLLNCKSLRIWDYWKMTTIKVTRSIRIMDRLLVPQVIEKEHVSVADAVGDDGVLPPPCYDPLKILRWIADSSYLFDKYIPHCAQISERLQQVRMSLAHQSNILKPWKKSGINATLKDMVDLMKGLTEFATGGGEAPQEVDDAGRRFHQFSACVLEKYTFFNDRRRRTQTAAKPPADEILIKHLRELMNLTDETHITLVCSLTAFLRTFHVKRRSTQKAVKGATPRNMFALLAMDNDDDDDTNNDEGDDKEEEEEAEDEIQGTEEANDEAEGDEFVVEEDDDQL